MVSRFIPTPGEGKNDGPARDAAKASGVLPARLPIVECLQ
jgi:hypothetical protein